MNNFNLKLFIVIFYVTTNLSGQIKKPLNVLFIGNSYTAANNLSTMVFDMSNNAGDSINQSNLTGGGQTLWNHAASNSPSMNEINTGLWDVIVLQEQSQIPSFTEPEVETYFYPAVKYIDSVILKANPCAKTMLYMTWGRKYGDVMNCPNWPPVCTYDGMDSLLKKRYLKAAHDNGNIASPVGAVWHYIIKNYPEIDLYEADNSHPSFIGTYTTAACMYTSLFKKSPKNFNVKYHLDDSTILKIKNAIDSVVLPFKDLWNLNVYDLKSLFTYRNSNDTVHFANNSKNASEYLWDFGDGNTSTLKEPKHSFKNGKYTIKLIASSCELSDTSEISIQIQNSNINNIVNHGIDIYPIPANHNLNVKINSAVESIYLYNNLGQILQPKIQFESGVVKLDLTGIPSGIYTLHIVNLNKTTYKERILVY
jgi:PKD repeat protein